MLCRRKQNHKKVKRTKNMWCARRLDSFASGTTRNNCIFQKTMAPMTQLSSPAKERYSFAAWICFTGMEVNWVLRKRKKTQKTLTGPMQFANVARLKSSTWATPQTCDSTSKDSTLRRRMHRHLSEHNRGPSLGRSQTFLRILKKPVESLVQ